MTIEYKDSKRIVALEADVATTEEAFSFTTTDTVNALWGNRIYGMKLLSGHSGLNKYIKKIKTYHPTNPTGSRLTTGTLYHVILDSSGTEIARSAGVSASSVSNNTYAETTLSSPVKLLENYTVGVTISTGSGSSYLGTSVNNNSSSPTNTTRYYKDESGTVTTSTSETIIMVFDSAPSSNKPTNVQDNSLLVEKDTARRYWFSEAPAPDLTYDDFPTSYSGWTKSSNDATKLVFSSNRANFSIGETYVDARAYGYDIGFDLDGDYCIDFDFTFTNTPFTSTGQAVAFTFGISTTTADVGGEDPTMNSEQTKIAGYPSGSYTYIYARAKSSAGTNASGNESNTAFPLNSSATQLRYGRLSRSGTTFKVQFFSESTRETEVANYSVTTTAQTVRYLYLKSYSQNSGQAWAGYLDNIKIYKDQSSPTLDTWINEFGITNGLMFGGVSTSSYANFSDSQSWNGVSWTAGGSLTGARQRGASAGTGSTSARYVNGYNDSPAPYPNSNRNESYNGTAWTSDTVHPQSVNNKGDGGCGTVDSMIVTGGHKNGTGDVNNYYKWTGSWTSIAQGITGSGGSISGTLTSALMTKSTSAQTWNGSSWTSSTATSTSRTFSPASGTSSTSGFRVFGTYANPFISTSESWNGTAWTARGSAPAGRVEAGCIPASTDSMMTLGGMQYHGASGSDLYSTDVYEYRKGTFTTGASFSNGRRSCGGAGS